MSIYITGDLHGELSLPSRLSGKKFPEGKQMTKDDFVIIAGDFGVIWDNNPYNKTEIYLLNWLDERKWTTIFIDGNHENFFRLSLFPIEERWGGKVRKINDSIFHLQRGEIFTLQEKKFFCFGGAESWDKDMRREGVSIWPEEVPNYEEKEYGLQNLKKHQYCVDYIVSHTIPKSIVKMIIGSDNANKGKKDSTCDYLEQIAQQVQYERFFCGHMHTDQEIGKFRLLYKDIVPII